MVLLSQHIAKLLFEKREIKCGLAAGGSVQLIEVAVKISAGSKPKIYLKLSFLCLQTPLLGDAPHGLGLVLLYHPLPQTQISLSTAWERTGPLVPRDHLFPLLASWSHLQRWLIFPWQPIFENTLVICAKIAGGARALGFFKFSSLVEL